MKVLSRRLGADVLMLETGFSNFCEACMNSFSFGGAQLARVVSMDNKRSDCGRSPNDPILPRRTTLELLDPDCFDKDPSELLLCNLAKELCIVDEFSEASTSEVREPLLPICCRAEVSDAEDKDTIVLSSPIRSSEALTLGFSLPFDGGVPLTRCFEPEIGDINGDCRRESPAAIESLPSRIESLPI